MTRAHAFFQAVNLFKWGLFALTQYDVIVFADIDLELLPFSEVDLTVAASAWRLALQRFFHQRELLVVAEPDPYSPFNGGLMLMRPSPEVYQEGIEVLRACRFNRTHGWELSGVAPSQVMVQGTPVAMNPFLRGRLPWDFGGASSEQGFFFHMLYLRRQLGAYGAQGKEAAHGERLVTRHFWSGIKPWLQWRDQGLYKQGAIDPELEPLTLARLYDYVMREAPVPVMREATEGTEAAEAAAGVPRLVATLRAVRRLIEAHPSFDDALGIWQAHSWVATRTCRTCTGGYAYHQNVPILPLTSVVGSSTGPPASE